MYLFDYLNRQKKINNDPPSFNVEIILGFSFLLIILFANTIEKYWVLILIFFLLINIIVFINDKYQINYVTKIILQFILIFSQINLDLVVKQTKSSSYSKLNILN